MSVTDEAIEQIKSMIVSGELAPGARLPKEDELAARLGLSRSSLREAVRALAFVRILDVRQGDGTFVTSLRPELLLEAVSFVVDFHQDDSVLHFLHVRRIVEPAATALAARSASESALDALEELLDPDILDLPPHEFVERDRLFHRGIVGECGNPVLVSLLDSISGPIHRARIWRGVTELTANERTLREHRGILDALRRRDADVASARALTHIAGVEEWLRRAVPLPFALALEELEPASERHPDDASHPASVARPAAGGRALPAEPLVPADPDAPPAEELRRRWSHSLRNDPPRAARTPMASDSSRTRDSTRRPSPSWPGRTIAPARD